MGRASSAFPRRSVSGRGSRTSGPGAGASRDRTGQRSRISAPSRADFEDWRKAGPAPVMDMNGLDGLVGHYSFDVITNARAANLAGTNGTAKLSDGPRSVPGPFGQALEFSGENSAVIEKVGDL